MGAPRTPPICLLYPPSPRAGGRPRPRWTSSRRPHWGQPHHPPPTSAGLAKPCIARAPITQPPRCRQRSSEMLADIWPDESVAPETIQSPRRAGKPPVTSIRSWLECYGRMAAVLSMRFPEKAAELWAYQTTILHAAHAYEGANWVAYDRLYRREMLAKKDLNWSVPNPRLYSEAFTGRAKRHPQCPHCLSEDHEGAAFPLACRHRALRRKAGMIKQVQRERPWSTSPGYSAPSADTGRYRSRVALPRGSYRTRGAACGGPASPRIN